MDSTDLLKKKDDEIVKTVMQIKNLSEKKKIVEDLITELRKKAGL